GAGIVMLTITGINNDFVDLIFSNSGATSGTTVGLAVTAAETYLSRVVVHDVRSTGINFSSTGGTALECETYACDKANTSGISGMDAGGSGTILIRCISHDNTGANACGFGLTGAGATAVNCIADSNGAHGFRVSSTTGANLFG